MAATLAPPAWARSRTRASCALLSLPVRPSLAFCGGKGSSTVYRYTCREKARGEGGAAGHAWPEMRRRGTAATAALLPLGMGLALGVLLVSMGARETRALQLDVAPRNVRCIGEEFDTEDTVFFTFQVVVPEAGAGDSSSEDPQPITKKNAIEITITTPSGKIWLQERLREDIEQEKRPTETGLHRICFKSKSSSTHRVFFDVEINRGDKARPYVSQGHLKPIEAQLIEASQALQNIQKEIDYARRQEGKLKEASDRTNAQIQWFSILSIAILLGMSAWQLIYLRNFFKTKKLL